MDCVIHIPSDQFGWVPAEHLHCEWVDKGDHSIQVYTADPFLDGMQNKLVLPFCLR